VNAVLRVPLQLTANLGRFVQDIVVHREMDLKAGGRLALRAYIAMALADFGRSTIRLSLSCSSSVISRGLLKTGQSGD
jgi:hypothetical protein